MKALLNLNGLLPFRRISTAFFWLSRERRMASRRRITQATKRPGENKDDQ